MPTFDAAADQLAYNFSAFSTADDAVGVIPEPSTEQVETFMEVLRQVMPTKLNDQGERVLDVEKMATSVAEGTDLELLFNTAIADLCSNTPSISTISALPFRVKQRFYGWIVGTFLSPEA